MRNHILSMSVYLYSMGVSSRWLRIIILGIVKRVWKLTLSINKSWLLQVYWKKIYILCSNFNEIMFYSISCCVFTSRYKNIYIFLTDYLLPGFTTCLLQWNFHGGLCVVIISRDCGFLVSLQTVEPGPLVLRDFEIYWNIWNLNF